MKERDLILSKSFCAPLFVSRLDEGRGNQTFKIILSTPRDLGAIYRRNEALSPI